MTIWFDYKEPLLDFTCIRRLNHTYTTSPWNQLNIWLPKNLSWTSPACDDSTMQIRLHLKTKWPYDYQKTFPGLHLHPATQPCKYDFTLKPNVHMTIKKPFLDFTCIRRLNHVNTTSPENQMTIWLKKKPSLDFTCTRRLNHANTTSP